MNAPREYPSDAGMTHTVELRGKGQTAYPVHWFSMDHAEAKGRVGIIQGGSGLGLVVEDPVRGDEDGLRRIAGVDLYYESREGQAYAAVRPEPADEITPRVRLIIDDVPDSADVLFAVRYLTGGTRLIANYPDALKRVDP